MDLNDINATIKYYEKQGTNLENCRILADLYTCKTYMENNYSNDDKELNDILPMYHEYCNVKREYQLGNVNKEKVIDSMHKVCQELNEFILVLYSCSDMQDERDLLDKMLNKLGKSDE